MKKACLKLLLLFMLLGGGMEAYAQATLSMDDVKLKPGETAEISIDMSNSVDIQIASFQISLSDGLVLVPAYYDEDIEEYRVMQFAPERKPKRGQLEENLISDNTINVLAYSSADGGIFKGSEGAILYFTVKALENTAPGTYSITLTGSDKLVSPDEVGYNQEDVTADVTVYQVVEVKVSSEGHGSVSGGGEYETGTEITLTATPDEGYHFVKWSDGSTKNPYTFVVNGAAELIALFEANKYEVVFTIDGEVVKKDSVAYGAAITVPEAPAKEGHTFTGWGEIPASMPAKDLAFTGTYTVNRYAVVYKVDGKVYKTDSVAYNAPITVEPAPVKEGHTFSGWSEVPSLMPAKDVEVTGSFTVNKYEIVFIFDGEVVEKGSVAYGSVLVAPDVEEKEGHSVTWDKLPKTMPANDLTINGRYIANVYILVYKVDGVVYKTYNVTYNAPITVEPAPVKEGHTFSGWSEVPSLMPAKDVEVTGSFTVNQYNVTFVVDGEVIAEYVVNYGETISLPETPYKEGHTFSGWDGVPETMPAKDLTISGTFVINKYLVTFKIGDEVIASYSLEYGAAIVIPEAPEKEGHTFNGWGEVAETVLAGDVTYEGTYTVNIYKVYYYVGEELVHTAEVAYGEAIPEYVYEPAEDGYTFLGWVGETYTTMPAHDVTYTANIDDAIEHLTIDNGELTIYDLAGRKVTDTENLRSGIYIINGRKVIVK